MIFLSIPGTYWASSSIIARGFPDFRYKAGRRSNLFAVDQFSLALLVAVCRAASAMGAAGIGDGHEIHDRRVELGAFPFSHCHRCDRHGGHLVVPTG
jgi:hypothetical protein